MRSSCTRENSLALAYCEKAFDVYAIEVGLDFWDSAAICQGLHESHQGACHNGITYADAHECGIRRPKPPCSKRGIRYSGPPASNPDGITYTAAHKGSIKNPEATCVKLSSTVFWRQ